MALRDLSLPTTQITVSGGSFAVRGLSFADITQIAQDHGAEAAMVFGEVTGQYESGTLSQDGLRGLISRTAPRFVDLTAAVISLAADDYSPEAIAMAKRLPVPAQVEAVEAIFLHTFTSESEVKKFAERIIRMMSGVSSTLRQVQLPVSGDGSGASEGK